MLFPILKDRKLITKREKLKATPKESKFQNGEEGYPEIPVRKTRNNKTHLIKQGFTKRSPGVMVRETRTRAIRNPKGCIKQKIKNHIAQANYRRHL